MSWCPDPSTCKAEGACCGKISPGYPIQPAEEAERSECIVGKRFGYPCQTCERGEDSE